MNNYLEKGLPASIINNFIYLGQLKDMNQFNSIKELFNTLNRGSKLLTELFEKRKTLSYKFEHALDLMEDNEDTIHLLISKGVINQNGPYIEIDEQFLGFFEQILEVNEIINTAYINGNFDEVKQNILYYLQESNESRKNTYLKAVKSTLKKIGRITIRNIVDLKRNVENTFKTEPNFKVKLSKLENHKKKLSDIRSLIEKTEELITIEERTFFTTALDEELRLITVNLKLHLRESRHNLIETQKQIVEFINQIKSQSEFIEKLRQIKYLKDQFEIRAKTNINAILADDNALAFETKPNYPLKLSLDELQEYDSYEIILKINRKIKTKVKPIRLIADSISDEYLELETENEIHINLDEVRNSFTASGNHLFDFIQQYQFPRKVLYEERVTLYCQMISMFEKDLEITENFNRKDDVEYAMVHPKSHRI